MRRESAFTVAGAVLVAAGLIGLLTVADDLRHVGELAGVAAVLLAGLALVVAGTGVVARHLALEWVPVGFGAGLVAGAALDATPAAVATGLVAGLALAAAFRRRRRSDGRPRM